MPRLYSWLAGICVIAAPVSAQQLGAKVMGALGIDAGTQSPPGLYVVERFVQFTADQARDRNGDRLPIRGLDILARANALGVAYTLAPHRSPYLTVAASVPFARASVNSDNPIVSIDRFGLGDAYVQPMKIGWRAPTYDAVASYAFYAPTGKFEPKSAASVGRGNWSHQFSLGGALYPDTARAWRMSAIMDYEINQKKRGIDVRRGDMLDVQGGAGVTVRRVFVVGIAGYGLWQVRNDRGSDLPPALAGARTRSYGIGPELDVTAPKLGLRAELRYEWDLAVRSRPQGQVLAVAIAYRAKSK